MIKRKEGFTLLEIMVVIIIIGVLSVMAVSYYERALERVRTAEVIQLFGSTLSAQERFRLKRDRYAHQWNLLDVAPMGVFDIVNNPKYANADKTHFYTNGSGGESSFRPGFDVYFEEIGGSWFIVAERIGWGGYKYTFVREFESPITFCLPKEEHVDSANMCADVMGVDGPESLPADPRIAAARGG